MSEYEWVEVSGKATFAPRDGAGALVFDGRMWLLGGWSPEDKQNFPKVCNDEVWSSKNGSDWRLEKAGTFGTGSFDPATDWEGRHCASYAVFDDKMWIMGGDTNQGHYQYDVWNSSDGRTWEHVNKGQQVPWGPRCFQYTCVFKNRIWVMGGQTVPQSAEAEERYYADVWHTGDGIDWQQIVPTEPSWPHRGCIGGSVVFKDRMWVLGGGSYWTPNVPEPPSYNDVWSSDDGVNWRCHLDEAPWSKRHFHNVAVFDNRMWVMEGCDMACPNAAAIAAATAPRGPKMAHWISTTNLNDVWYSDDGEHWVELGDTPWAPRHAASVFVHDEALWMVAGNNLDSDVWKLVRTGP